MNTGGVIDFSDSTFRTDLEQIHMELLASLTVHSGHMEQIRMELLAP